MKPGGHLATALALGGAGYVVTGSAELAGGCFAGGFLIDADHYLDYLAFERQWRRPGPTEFLRYYFRHRYQRIVLALHSLELLVTLALLSVAWPRPALLGYLFGALLHVTLDILVNGEHLLKRPVLFYSFAYRASLGFATARLQTPLVIPPEAGQAPIREFFTWRHLVRPVQPEHQGGQRQPEQPPAHP
ncbi:MAG: hypothetical protein HY726_03395 [Candidatus Rokubacteria bacterium]|nr:hypothetical protein [Candidatus Rokubacteria bacterium]